jgi:hypothetical protein
MTGQSRSACPRHGEKSVVAPYQLNRQPNAVALQFRRRCDQLIDNSWQRDRCRLAHLLRRES